MTKVFSFAIHLFTYLCIYCPLTRHRELQSEIELSPLVKLYHKLLKSYLFESHTQPDPPHKAAGEEKIYIFEVNATKNNFFSIH